jgi:hypothetical protein
MSNYNWVWGIGVLLFGAFLAFGLVTGAMAGRAGAIYRNETPRLFWFMALVYAAAALWCLYKMLQ